MCALVVRLAKKINVELLTATGTKELLHEVIPPFFVNIKI